MTHKENIMAILECYFSGFKRGIIESACNRILEIEPKTGYWRHYEGMLICSECGAEFYDDIMEYCGDDVPKYCPNCGAKMERSDKE